MVDHMYKNDYYFEWLLIHIRSRPLSEILLKFVVIEKTRYDNEVDDRCLVIQKINFLFCLITLRKQGFRYLKS